MGGDLTVRELTYEQLFKRRINRKDAQLRDFITKAEEVRQTMSPSHDRDVEMVRTLTEMLEGPNTWRGMDSEAITRIMSFIRSHAGAHQHVHDMQSSVRALLHSRETRIS